MGTSDELSDSLHGALSKARVPVENDEFIRRITAAIGIAEYRAMAVDSSKPYVLATRKDGQADLHIHYGFTNGFTSDDEAVRAAGLGVERQQSSQKGTWYVAHPLTKVAPRGERSQDVRRQGRMCACGMQRSVSGVCGSCD